MAENLLGLERYLAQRVDYLTGAVRRCGTAALQAKTPEARKAAHEHRQDAEHNLGRFSAWLRELRRGLGMAA